MLDRDSKLDYHFWDVSETLDDEQMIEQWYVRQTCTDFDRAVLDLFMLKYSCKDYRETGMKDDKWQRSVSKIAKTILGIEKLHCSEQKEHIPQHACAIFR
jgi:hypothetical protein